MADATRVADATRGPLPPPPSSRATRGEGAPLGLPNSDSAASDRTHPGCSDCLLSGLSMPQALAALLEVLLPAHLSADLWRPFHAPTRGTLGAATRRTVAPGAGAYCRGLRMLLLMLAVPTQ